MRPLARFALALLVSTAAATAQCPTVSIIYYGQTCLYFRQPAPLNASYDNQGCSARFQLSRSNTCCNTFARLQVLMFGVQPIDPGFPHPLLVPGCLLSVQPLIAIAQPISAGGILDVPVPPIRATIYAQGINVYFTTIGRTDEFQSSDAVQMDIR